MAASDVEVWPLGDGMGGGWMSFEIGRIWCPRVEPLVTGDLQRESRFV